MYDYVDGQSKDDLASGAAFEPPILFSTFIKGYYPDGITRDKRMGRRFRPELFLHDVTSFTLSVNEAERNQLIREFLAYSYVINMDGERQIVSGPEITFALVPAKPNAARTLVIDLSANGTKTGEPTIKFGDASELRIRGGAATWVFTFPR